MVVWNCTGDDYRSGSRAVPKRFRCSSEVVPGRYGDGQGEVPQRFRCGSEAVHGRLRRGPPSVPLRFWGGSRAATDGSPSGSAAVLRRFTGGYGGVPQRFRCGSEAVRGRFGEGSQATWMLSHWMYRTDLVKNRNKPRVTRNKSCINPWQISGYFVCVCLIIKKKKAVNKLT